MKNIIINLALHDLLYLWASSLVQTYKPCNLHMENGEVRCQSGWGPCCNGCKHLATNGCTVMALNCKVCFCHAACYSLPNYVKDLLNRIQALMQQIDQTPYIRESRGEWLKRLKKKGGDTYAVR
jgi:hypothetical protein